MSTQRERDRKEERRSKAASWAEKQGKGRDSTCVKLPEGAKFFKLEKPGTYLIDIMPYKVGKGNPQADPGEEHFEREYECHRIATVDGTQLFTCRARVFKLPCPACEWRMKNQRRKDEELYKSLKPQLRHLWNVIDLDSKDRVVKVWDTNHYNRKIGFGEQLVAAINAARSHRTTEKFANFYELKGGFSLRLLVEEQPLGGGGKYHAATRIDFVERDEDYPPSIMEQCVCLDECLVDPGYDAMRQALGEDDDEERTPPARVAGASTARPAAGAKEAVSPESRKGGGNVYRPGELVSYRNDEWEVKRVSRAGLLTLESLEDEVIEDVEPADVERVPVKD